MSVATEPRRDFPTSDWFSSLYYYYSTHQVPPTTPQPLSNLARLKNQQKIQMARLATEESYLTGIPITWPSPITTPTTKLYCNSCNTSTAILFCSHHSAFLCFNCDAKLHLINGVDSIFITNSTSINQHRRVPVCELCERSPAAVTCKADSASLCVHCDAEIHSANPLSRRHERVPVTPLPFNRLDVSKSVMEMAPIVIGGFDVGDFLVPTIGDFDRETKQIPSICSNEVKSEDLFFTDFDNSLLDFDLPDFKEEMVSFNCSDGVVPIHQTANSNSSVITSFDALDNSFDIDFGKPELPIYTSNTSIQTVSNQTLTFSKISQTYTSFSIICRYSHRSA